MILLGDETCEEDEDKMMMTSECNKDDSADDGDVNSQNGSDRVG
jgi:hypothetical protein